MPITHRCHADWSIVIFSVHTVKKAAMAFEVQRTKEELIFF